MSGHTAVLTHCFSVYQKVNIRAKMHPCAALVCAMFMLAAPLEAQTSQPVNQAPANQAYVIQAQKAHAFVEEGKLYHDGAGVLQDFKRARALYKMAADQGSAAAAINLGYMSHVGEGVAKDYSESKTWYQKAANSGSRAAQRMMAVIYKNGLGVSRDQERADIWSRRAQNGWKYPEPAASRTKITVKPIVKTQLNITGPIAGTLLTPPVSSMSASHEALYPQAMDAGVAPTPGVTLRARDTGAPEVKPVTVDLIIEESVIVKSAIVVRPVLSAATGERVVTQAARTDVSDVSDFSATPAGLNSAQDNSLLNRVLLGLFFVFGFLSISHYFKAPQNADDSEGFAKQFYDRNALILRNSYKRASHNKIGIDDINDHWVVSISLMIIRYAQVQESLTGIRSKTSEHIIAALRVSPISARQQVMPLVPKIRDMILMHSSSAEETHIPSKVSTPKGTRSKPRRAAFSLWGALRRPTTTVATAE